MSDSLAMQPIGFYRGEFLQKYELPRQSGFATVDGWIELNSGFCFEQALQDLEGFDRIWIVYWAHQAQGWKPMLRPPRSAIKRGLFSTRAPHRPNPIGLSAVKLLQIHGRRLQVTSADLLDGTPILDLKPYLPYADAYPDAAAGWVDSLPASQYAVLFAKKLEPMLQWLRQKGVDLVASSQASLSLRPFPAPNHRVRPHESSSEQDHRFELAIRTWRLDFERDEKTRHVHVVNIRSGHAAQDLISDSNPWPDLPLHREFLQIFGKDQR